MTPTDEALAQYGVSTYSEYLGAERFSPSRAQEMHAWQVTVSHRAAPDMVFGDRWRCTAQEFQAINDGRSVEEYYFTDLTDRMTTLIESGTRDYDAWLAASGVVLEGEWGDLHTFWRDRFLHDQHTLRLLNDLLGGRAALLGFLAHFH